MRETYEAVYTEQYADEILKRTQKDIDWLKEHGFSRKQLSDGWHTFEELYYHRMILTLVICKQNKDKAFKSKLHHDGTMFDDSFIVGIMTPKGQFTYHYDLKYWDLFEDIPELEKAPIYDGHKPSDIDRLLSLCE